MVHHRLIDNRRDVLSRDLLTVRGADGIANPQEHPRREVVVKTGAAVWGHGLEDGPHVLQSEEALYMPDLRLALHRSLSDKLEHESGRGSGDWCGDGGARQAELGVARPY
jgi:hypothetical protein